MNFLSYPLPDRLTDLLISWGLGSAARLERLSRRRQPDLRRLLRRRPGAADQELRPGGATPEEARIFVWLVGLIPDAHGDCRSTPGTTPGVRALVGRRLARHRVSGRWSADVWLSTGCRGVRRPTSGLSTGCRDVRRPTSGSTPGPEESLADVLGPAPGVGALRRPIPGQTPGVDRPRSGRARLARGDTPSRYRQDGHSSGEMAF